MDKYQIGAVIHGDDQVVDSCFHADGRMFMAATKCSIQVIDSLTGEEKKKIFTKTHGIGSVVFTHHEQCVLASSVKSNNDIRYLSLYDNRYLRFFKGHQAQVTSLSMSPVDDYFLSSSCGNDRSVCLWSLANPSPIARLSLPQNCINPKVAHTYDGLIFGVMVKNVSSGSHCIRLFDARSYEKGPFLQLKPSRQRLEKALKVSCPFIESAQLRRCVESTWESFAFNADGTRALVNTSSGMIISLDAFSDDGDPIVYFTEEKSQSAASQPSLTKSSSPQLGYCFTPDSLHVLSGTEGKKVRIYESNSGRPVGLLTPDVHTVAVTSVRCNPKYEVIATSGINTVLWLKSSLFDENQSST